MIEADIEVAAFEIQAVTTRWSRTEDKAVPEQGLVTPHLPR